MPNTKYKKKKIFNNIRLQESNHQLLEKTQIFITIAIFLINHLFRVFVCTSKCLGTKCNDRLKEEMLFFVEKDYITRRHSKKSLLNVLTPNLLQIKY